MALDFSSTPQRSETVTAHASDTLTRIDSTEIRPRPDSAWCVNSYDVENECR